LRQFRSLPIFAYMETAIRPDGMRIRLLRVGRRMNGTALAERVGVTRHHLANVELGRSTPSLDLLVRIANELDVSVDYLLGRDQEKAA
jgi:transcriptional regulator with XRE-family HTH domain